MTNISSTTNLSVRVDTNLKQEADALFKDLGLNTSTAINMFLSHCVKTASIPFKIQEPRYSQEVLNALKESDYMIKHPELYKGYHDVDEMFKDILDEE